MWAAIKEDASLRDQVGASNWARMVEETGGDPPEKAAELVLELFSEQNNNVNGQFLWIKDGIQTPIPSW